MTINDLRTNGLIVLECISGSKAYGLDTPTSDTDIKGVFMLPKADFYGLNYIPQINNETNDIVFYEFRRFMELLSVNNPNILELLSAPPSTLLYKHASLNVLNSDFILSKLCRDTFGKFALSQIKKAKGLNKKIVNPISPERKSILSFCFVSHNQGSIPLIQYLEIMRWKQSDCGLVNIPHMKDIYGLYHNPNAGYKGILRHELSNDLSLSSIPKGEIQSGLLYFNKDGYSTYCREYKEYWDWVGHRNEVRYENTQSHGKNYDSKNMMHTFRLLDMAIEIAKEKRINVTRPNRDFLLKIKSGEYEYEDLLKMAEDKKIEMEEAYNSSLLPDKPDLKLINRLTFEIRNEFYLD